MTVNVYKTKTLLITTQQKRSKLKRIYQDQDQILKVTMNEQSFLQIQEKKLIGVVIDQDFTWKIHVSRVCNVVKCNLALLRRFKFCLPFDTRILFYQNFIQVYFDYCSVV